MKKTITIDLTTGTLPEQLAEAHDKLDAWLSCIPGPPPNQMQCLRMVSFSPLVYELSFAPWVDDKYPRRIL